MMQAGSPIGPLARLLIRTFVHEAIEAAFYRIIFHRIQDHEAAEALYTGAEARA